MDAVAGLIKPQPTGAVHLLSVQYHPIDDTEPPERRRCRWFAYGAGTGKDNLPRVAEMQPPVIALDMDVQAIVHRNTPRFTSWNFVLSILCRKGAKGGKGPVSKLTGSALQAQAGMPNSQTQGRVPE